MNVQELWQTIQKRFANNQSLNLNEMVSLIKDNAVDSCISFNSVLEKEYYVLLLNGEYISIELWNGGNDYYEILNIGGHKNAIDAMKYWVAEYYNNDSNYEENDIYSYGETLALYGVQANDDTFILALPSSKNVGIWIQYHFYPNTWGCVTDGWLKDSTGYGIETLIDTSSGDIKIFDTYQDAEAWIKTVQNNPLGIVEYAPPKYLICETTDFSRFC